MNYIVPLLAAARGHITESPHICRIANQLGAAEAMLLADRAGVDPHAVKEALMGGFAASRMLDLQAPKMISRDFDGRIESRRHHKDIHIVLDLARAFGIEFPASAAAADVLDRLQQRGGARRSISFPKPQPCSAI